MIKIEGVTKSFGDYVALENFSCDMEEGHIYGLVGYNGAGKTTLFKTIAGIYRPEAGRVLIDGEPVYENEALKRRLFMVQDDAYFTPQGTLHSMALFYSGFYPSWSNKTYRTLLEFFELDPAARINGFSKGMTRQASLILALSTMPKYLLLDESFDGLDLSKRNLLKGILFEYMAKQGTNILISSHNLRELEGLCDHVAIMKDRQLSFAASVEEMRRRRTKFRVTFHEEIDKNTLRSIDARNIEGENRTYTFIWDGDKTALEQVLASAKPALLETEPMTLEEIFLEEMEDKEYDFNKLF